jgi:hypothetical protein
MKTKINQHYPNQTVNNHHTSIYIADYTKQTSGLPEKRSVEISEEKPMDIDSFFVENEHSIPFCSVIFDNSSFVDAEGKPLSQCECACFSAVEYAQGPWVLFLELKYSEPSSSSYYKKENVDKAKGQLLKTFGYYKQVGIIAPNQQCYLVISFPHLLPPFPSFTTTPAEIRRLRKRDNVILRVVNELKIESELKLKV